jgi:regulator of sigma E protease
VLYQITETEPSKPIAVTVQRGKDIVQASLQPRMPEKDERAAKYRKAALGLAFEPMDAENPRLIYPSPATLVADCFRNTAATLQKLVTPKSPIGPSQMSGPVGILNVYYNIFKNPHWWRLILWFSVMLNVGLAIFNMLPLPVLDGGHIVMATLEAIRKRPPNIRLMEYVQVACVLCLLSFVVFVTLKDVGHIASGDESGKFEFKPRPAAPAVP